MKTSLVGLLLILCPWVSGLGAEAHPYRVDYVAEFEPSRGAAQVTIRWGDGADRLRRLELKTHERMSGFQTNVQSSRDGEYLVLESLRPGAELSYEVAIDSPRGDGVFDARITQHWAIWRGDDLVPAGKVRQLKDTEAEAFLTLKGPSGWTFKTPYEQLKDGRYRITNPTRSFDRPTGWMVGGRIGVRVEKIAGIQVAVAGPVGQDVRRMDLLALMNWTLPSLIEVLPDMPKRLLLVSAREGMWRGGLSAGNSLYLHADRPLISENGTSTLVHELVHVASGLRGGDGADWIVEGFAEYYSLKLLRRSGGISVRRFDRALDSLRQWSEDAGPLDARRSTGPTTAKAALILHSLDLELQSKTGGRSSLDDVLRALADLDSPVTLAQLRQAQQMISGSASQALKF
ncbi:MAG: hypothetical protein AAF358_12050 [Pseudomonadota bacterium]